MGCGDATSKAAGSAVSSVILVFPMLRDRDITPLASRPTPLKRAEFPPLKSLIPTTRVTFCAAILCCTVACHRPVSRSPIIDQYRVATCVSWTSPRVAGRASREWDIDLSLSDGSKVRVSGAQMPGGRISVRFLATGRESEAANAGDYVYPSDVRLNAENDLLYVKASGLAGGVWHETWLFKYDLHSQRLMARQQVVDDALPPECPEPLHLR